MTKKTKHLIVRITEDQFRKLADVIITEQKNKSIIVRTALDNYMDGNKSGNDNQDKKNNRNIKT